MRAGKRALIWAGCALLASLYGCGERPTVGDAPEAKGGVVADQSKDPEMQRKMNERAGRRAGGTLGHNR